MGRFLFDSGLGEKNMLYIGICEDEVSIGSRLEEMILRRAEIENVVVQ